MHIGHNVDAVDVPSGMQELTECGYNDPKTRMVIEYALMRWARGEEKQAERGAIDTSFHGISFTCWRRVLAAAIVGKKPDGSEKGEDAMTLCEWFAIAAMPPCYKVESTATDCHLLIADAEG